LQQGRVELEPGCRHVVLPAWPGTLPAGKRRWTEALRGHAGALGHRDAPARSSRSYANGRRPWPLVEKVFYGLVEIVAANAVGKKKFRFTNTLVRLDSTVIDLCLSMYDWAKCRRTEGAVKLHLVLDHAGDLPCFGIVTDGKVADVKAAHHMHCAPDTIVVDDRGYHDDRLFAKWTDAGVYFVPRMKANTLFERVEEHAVPQNRNIVKDQTVRLIGTGAHDTCLHLLRRGDPRGHGRHPGVSHQPSWPRRFHHRCHLQGSLAD